MIDHILGRPSRSLRRSQIFLVLFFWVWRLYKGDGSAAPLPSRTIGGVPATPSSRAGGGGQRRGSAGKRTLFWRIWVALVGRSKFGAGWMGRINDRLKNFTPYQLILGTLTIMYALRHLDDLFGLGAPEPLAAMYSRSYFRATYANTAFDAGFASAMTIRPKWLKDICSMLFSVYYLVWASEGDEVLRRFRALCTVEMLRVTWEKTRNPYIRLITTFQRPPLPIVRHVVIPRPASSSRANLPPVKAMLFFDGSEKQLSRCTELIVDFPGGGFIAMGPDCHEERLRRWAKRTGKPVLGIDYGKAPEYPYPWAIEEGFDAYRTLVETKGSSVGIRSGKLGIVLTGDSAGGNICTTIIIRILEHHTAIPRPVSIILAYPALDFNFTSWMSPSHLRVLRTEHSENNIPGLKHGKDHMSHKSPLAVVDDVSHRKKSTSRSNTRQKSWGEALSSRLPGLTKSPTLDKTPLPGSATPVSGWARSLPRVVSEKVTGWLGEGVEREETTDGSTSDASDSGSEDDEDDDSRTVKAFDQRSEAEKSLKQRVKTPKEERKLDFAPVVPKAQETPGDVSEAPVAKPKKVKKRTPIGTRLTMTSRVGYFQDRTISPSMMRAMAILYVGPTQNPDFATDYYISPILAPPELLAHFPPVYLICGERDPFVDDTVIFSGRLREAKRARRFKAEQAAQSRSAKFGEGLRMSTSTSSATNIPDHILRESDDDWVQTRIIEGWGHGFMQMTTLMKEVDLVLTEMADWIDESFEKALETQRDIQNVMAAQSHRPEVPAIKVVHDDRLAPHGSTHVKPVREYATNPQNGPLGGADLGTPVGGYGSTAEDEEDTVLSFTPKTKKKNPPPTRFNPVPRRKSKENLNLQRVSSAPKFDQDDTGSSGEAMTIKTPPLGSKYLPFDSGDLAPKGTGAFAFFSSNRPSQPPPVPIPPPSTGIYGSVGVPRRGSNDQPPPAFPRYGSKPTNSLVAAAVAGARAASPALAAAGLVPESVGNVSEAELMRRRRLEAVFGMGETDSANGSDAEDEEEDMYA